MDATQRSEPGTAQLRRQRGGSLVEAMVGVALSLLVVAAASTLLAGHWREARTLKLEARLAQELRSAADIVGRDLRRAGHWGAALGGVWQEGGRGVAANPYAALAPSAAASDAASLRYSRDAVENGSVDGNEQFGFRLRGGVIELQLGAGNWQALTDAGTLTVTEFAVVPAVQSVALDAFCAAACPPGSAACPRQQVRSVALRIAGRLVADGRVARRIGSEVRLRNDAIDGACAI